MNYNSLKRHFFPFLHTQIPISRHTTPPPCPNSLKSWSLAFSMYLKDRWTGTCDKADEGKFLMCGYWFSMNVSAQSFQFSSCQRNNSINWTSFRSFVLCPKPQSSLGKPSSPASSATLSHCHSTAAKALLRCT